MSWVKIDDRFGTHPKAMEAGAEAIGVWVRGLCWTACHLTDGFLPDSARNLLAFDATSAPELLVECGLWERVEGGWRIHDYLDWNPSGAQVREKRRKDLERKKGKQENSGKDSARNPNGIQASRTRTRTSSNTPKPPRKKKQDEPLPDGVGDLLADTWRQVQPNASRAITQRVRRSYWHHAGTDCPVTPERLEVVGRYLSEAWNFPANLDAAIRHGHKTGDNWPDFVAKAEEWSASGGRTTTDDGLGGYTPVDCGEDNGLF